MACRKAASSSDDTPDDATAVRVGVAASSAVLLLHDDDDDDDANDDTPDANDDSFVGFTTMTHESAKEIKQQISNTCTKIPAVPEITPLLRSVIVPCVSYSNKPLGDRLSQRTVL
jgi:hypothetical protein